VDYEPGTLLELSPNGDVIRTVRSPG
jgi:hypothetical protein